METGTLQIELAAPERNLIKLEAREIVLPGKEGVFAVRAEHTPLLTTLIPGAVVIQTERNEDVYFAVGGGFAEVINDRVVVLAQTLESRDEIDLARAEAARDRATERLTSRDNADIDITRAELALARSLARIQAKSGHGY